MRAAVYGTADDVVRQCFRQLIYTAFKGVFTNRNVAHFSQIWHIFPNFDLIWTEFLHKISFLLPSQSFWRKPCTAVEHVRAAVNGLCIQHFAELNAFMGGQAPHIWEVINHFQQNGEHSNFYKIKTCPLSTTIPNFKPVHYITVGQ